MEQARRGPDDVANREDRRATHLHIQVGLARADATGAVHGTALPHRAAWRVLTSVTYRLLSPILDHQYPVAFKHVTREST